MFSARIPPFAIIIFSLLCFSSLTAQRPDLTGTWSNTIVTPLERPRTLGDRAFFTETEAREFERPDKIYERWNAIREADVDAKISTEIISPFSDTGFRKVGAPRKRIIRSCPAGFEREWRSELVLPHSQQRPRPCGLPPSVSTGRCRRAFCFMPSEPWRNRAR
jgi:hypothetical protein